MPTKNDKASARATTPFKVKMLSAAISVSMFPVAAPVAFAQDEPQLEEVVVTGSRITRFEGDYVAPVLSLGAEQMERSGKVNVEDFVSEVAALVGSEGSYEGADEGGAMTGVNALNMRNLGTNRTLVLVNGRRHVSAIATGEPLVDTNTIPTALIERVDVLTGGASAVYGADAVSGAVNFVLKDDFEGFDMRTQGSMSDRGDSEDYYASFVWGSNFHEGRGNITGSYEFRRQEKLEIFERDFGLENRQYLVNNPAEFRKTDDPNVPDRIVAGQRHYIFTSPAGRYDIMGTDPTTGEAIGFGDLTLNSQGNPYRLGTPVSGAHYIGEGGDGTPTAYFTNQFLPETEVHSVNALGRYDLTPAMTAFTELKYVKTDAVSPRNSSFTSALELTLDNPFLSDSFREVLAGVNDPTISLARDDLEMRSVDDNTRETFRAVVGLRGDLTDWLNYEVSANYGRTDVRASISNMRREDRYFAAIDAVVDPATGQPTCRSNLDPGAVPPNDDVVSSWKPTAWGVPANMTFTPGANSGCVPFNPFIDGTPGYFASGNLPDSAPNAAAIDFITGNGVPLVNRGKITQTVMNGFVAGNTGGLGLELPAGPVDFVFGGEYREEKIVNDINDISSNINALTQLNFELDSKSSYDVSELFTEVSVPVFDDLGPLLQALRLDGAYRFSDYSTIGQTSAFSVGLNWTLNDNFIVRGSHGQSVRSPNLEELFSPDNEASFRPDDVCEQTNLGIQTPTTVANCAAVLSALGVDPATFINAYPVGRPGVIGGNPDLMEETADTDTIGLVFTPTFLPDFVATLDYWKISLDQGILYPSDDEIVEQCYSAATLDNPFCSLFTRVSQGIEGVVGVVDALEQRPVNVSQIQTSGYDFSLSYRTELGFDAGSLSLSFAGTKLEELLTQPTVAPRLVDEVGQVSTLLGGQAPEWVFNLDAVWERGPISLAYGAHYQSGLDRYTAEEIQRSPDISELLGTKNLFVHDIQADYRFSEGLRAYAGVNNLSDRMPDVTYLNVPVGARGRVVYLGLNVSFESLSGFGFL